jgi:predicted PurR-regulated permease PerM
MPEAVGDAVTTSSADSAPVAASAMGPIPETPSSGLVHLRFRSIMFVVASIGLAILVRNVVDKSIRVLGWFAAATVVAALLEPVVSALARHMKRIVAVLVVVLALVGALGGLGYTAVDDIRTQIDRLQRELPDAAKEIESSQRYGEAATEFGLSGRVQSFVDELPGRLAGGDTADIVVTNATRGASFLAATVLMLFLLSHGPRAMRGGLNQITDRRRRRRVRLVLGRGYQRAWWYIVGSLGIALLAGAAAYATCRVADLPASAVLAITVALLSLIPYVGIVVGALPAVMLAFAFYSGWRALGVLAAFVIWQLIEGLVLRARLNRRSISIGPAVTLIVALMGLALYGFGGAIVALPYAVFFIAVIDELAPTDEDILEVKDLTG